MMVLRDPRPMSAFDPSRAALLHDNLQDQVLVWSPDRAEDWRCNARPDDDGVHWNGYVFDAWSTEFARPARIPRPRR